MIDNFKYHKYSDDVYSYSKHPDKWEIPFLLEHVFDLSIGDYVKNSNHCCYYSPVNSISEFIIESDNEDIVSVDDEMVYGNHRGRCELSFYSEDSIFSIIIIVYRGKFNFKLKRNTLFLEEGNMIPILTVLKHIHCPHYTDCLFEAGNLLIKDRDILWEINRLKDTIQDYKNIIDEFHNGHIVYHRDFDSFYNIQLEPVYKVSVREGFVNHINTMIKNRTFELRSLVRNLE